LAAPPLPVEKQRLIQDTYARLGSIRGTSRELGVSEGTVEKYARRGGGDTMYVAAPPMPGGYVRSDIPPTLPEPVVEAGGPALPDPVALSYDPFVIDTPGHAGILSDPHFPYHDKRTIESWAAECKSRNAAVLFLNGDVMDCGEVSTHHRDPSESRLEDEIEITGRFLAWLRAQFPRARIVWKEGNHEFRIPRYLAAKAPALAGSKFLTIPKLLELDKYGIEWVDGKRVVMLGKLPVVHGHEFRGGGGVNPARWLFLRAVSTAMCGHFHRTSEHHEQGLDRRLHGVWSVGCACYLYPSYDPNNKWNHGYALVDVSQDGSFRVTNRRILRDGQVV
jgi:predicted phosphodiesterase